MLRRGSEDVVLSVKEVAKKLEKSEETIKRYIRAGKFPNAYKNSDKEGWRIPLEDIETTSQTFKVLSKDNPKVNVNEVNEETTDLIILAYQGVTLNYPTDETIALLETQGIRRSLEILLVMRQSPNPVKNPYAFIKRAIKENWSPTTQPQKVNRKFPNANMTQVGTKEWVKIPFYNWLED